MPTTQVEIADWLGINQSEVSRHLRTLGLNAKTDELKDIIRAYCEHLRGIASGHSDEDGDSLIKERIETERIDRALKTLTLEEKRGNLVDVSKLEPALVEMVAAFKVEILSMADKVADDMRSLYGIEIDADIITGPVDAALSHLSRYDPEHIGAHH